MLSQYRYFLIAAEELNLKRAAERAFLSPQGMSNAIRQLENELGVKLFERVPRLSLTPEGELFRTAAREIYERQERLERQLSDHGAALKVQIDIGLQSCCQSFLLSEVIPAFKRSFPDTALNIVSDFSDKLEQAAAEGTLDFIIGDGAAKRECLQSVPLIEEKLYYIVSRELYATLPEKTRLEIDRQAGAAYDAALFLALPLMLYPAPSRLGTRIREYAEAREIALNVVLETNNTDIFPTLCFKGAGGAIVSEYNIKNIPQLNQTLYQSNPLLMFPIADTDVRPNTITLAFHKKKYMTKVHQELIAMIVRAIRSSAVDLPEEQPKVGAG